jgi:aldehyde dehydrogenase (NAD+)
MRIGTSSAPLGEVALRIGDSGLFEGSGGVFEHINPTTGEVQARIPMAGPSEIGLAVEAADRAFEEWRRWRPAARRDALLRLCDLLGEHKDELTRVGALENGSPVRTSSGRIFVSRQWLKYYAGWADKLEGTVTGSFIQGEDFTYSQPEPYGVIGVIITWNVPLISLCMKVSPALAAGNTVVIKPSELTPFTPDLFAQLAREAGIPAGVVNVVPGTAEAGQALVEDRRVQKVTFTGGPATARKIMSSCAAHLKPSVMELGGKSAFIVFDDADLDVAVHEAAYAGLAALSGQACLLGSRMLVQAAVYDEVLERLVRTAEAIPCGDPSDPDVLFGPVISSVACDRILGVLSRASEQKAGRLLTGGHRMGGDLANGFFIEPTIFADVDPESEIAQEEIFGPVMSVIRFQTEADAIELANDTKFGLAAYIQSRDINRVHRVADELRAGSVYVNGAFTVPYHSPFGGLGESGFGREGGRPGLDEFIRPKTVAISQLREPGRQA